MICNHLATAGRHIAAFATRGLVLAGIAATIAGCQTAQDETTASILDGTATDYRQRFPIEMVEKDRSLEIFVGSGRGLLPEQRAAVLAYAEGWQREGTGRFVIERPSNARNAHATSIAVSEIRAILTAAGAAPQAIRVHSYRAPERNLLAVVTINYPRLAAAVGQCGQWPDDLGASADRRHFENIEYWNFGCASRSNLAAMVANPNDLVQPRAETPVYAGRRSVALDKYRRGESPATVYPDASKGAISDLGK